MMLHPSFFRKLFCKSKICILEFLFNNYAICIDDVYPKILLLKSTSFIDLFNDNALQNLTKNSSSI